MTQNGIPGGIMPQLNGQFPYDEVIRRMTFETEDFDL